MQNHHFTQITKKVEVQSEMQETLQAAAKVSEIETNGPVCSVLFFKNNYSFQQFFSRILLMRLNFDSFYSQFFNF